MILVYTYIGARFPIKRIGLDFYNCFILKRIFKRSGFRQIVGPVLALVLGAELLSPELLSGCTQLNNIKKQICKQ